MYAIRSYYAAVKAMAALFTNSTSDPGDNIRAMKGTLTIAIKITKISIMLHCRRKVRYFLIFP